jgi:hypothetical protein
MGRRAVFESLVLWTHPPWRPGCGDTESHRIDNPATLARPMASEGTRLAHEVLATASTWLGRPKTSGRPQPPPRDGVPEVRRS